MDFLFANLNNTGADQGGSSPLPLDGNPSQAAGKVVSGAVDAASNSEQIIDFNRFFSGIVTASPDQSPVVSDQIGVPAIPGQPRIQADSAGPPPGIPPTPAPPVTTVTEIPSHSSRDGGNLPRGGKDLPDDAPRVANPSPVARRVALVLNESRTDIPIQHQVKGDTPGRQVITPREKAVAIAQGEPRHLPNDSALQLRRVDTESIKTADLKPADLINRIQDTPRTSPEAKPQLPPAPEPVRAAAESRVPIDARPRIANTEPVNQPGLPRPVSKPVAEVMADPALRPQEIQQPPSTSRIDPQVTRQPAPTIDNQPVIPTVPDKPALKETGLASDRPVANPVAIRESLLPAIETTPRVAAAVAASEAELATRLVLESQAKQVIETRATRTPGEPVPSSVPAVKTSFEPALLDSVAIRTPEPVVTTTPVTSVAPLSSVAFNPPQAAAMTLSVSHGEVINAGRFADATEWGNGLGERVNWMINQKQNTATIRLDPPVLGKLDVQVRIAEDSTLITIQTQHAQTREIVESASHRLRDYLQENGYQNVNVDVSQRQDKSQTHQHSAETDAESGSDESTQESTGQFQEPPASQHYAIDGLIDTFA